jgi:hypothetical protein
MYNWRQYLKECSDHAQNSRVIAYISLAIAAFGFIQNVLPLVNVDTSPLSRIPRLPVPWALTIFMAGSAALVIVGGYHRAVAEQTKRDDDVRKLKEQLTDIPRLHVVEGGFYKDVRTLSSEDARGRFTPLGELSCLHVKFMNDPKRSTGMSIARQVLAEIVFTDAKTEGEICRVRGRWGDTLEPSRLPQHLTPEDALATVDFAIGQIRELDIAYKYPDEQECYAMSNDTYGRPDWRYEKQKTLCNEIKARVRLRGVGVDASWEFRFENPNRGALRPIKYHAHSTAS